MQLYQTGFRPAQGYSQIDAEAAEAERAATRQTQAMQQQRFQWEVDGRKDDKAKANMYQWFEGQSAKYDPNLIMDKMIAGTAYDIEGSRGFSDDKKAEAFNAYRQISVNPDIMWFEGQWAGRKQAEDQKIANELMNDYRLGKISEKEFNLAARDENFQDWYRKSKLEDPTLGGQYDPTYETASEWLLGRKGSTGKAGKNIVERNPIKTALATTAIPLAGYTAGAYQLGKEALKVGGEAVAKAETIAGKYKGEYKPVEKFTKEQLTKGAGNFRATPGYKEWLKKNKLTASKDSFNKFSAEGYDILKKKADAGVKSAQEKMKLLEKKGLIKKIGRSWTKLPGFAKGIGLLGGMLLAEPIISSVTGSKKAGEVGGAGIGAALGGKYTKDQVKRNVINRLEKSGMKNVASNFEKIIAKKGWKWVLQTAGKKAPWLLTKVAGKTAAGAIGGSLTGGIMTAAMAAWTVADLVSLYNAITKEA